MKLKGSLRFLSFLNRRYDRIIKQNAKEDMKKMDSTMEFLEFKNRLRNQGQEMPIKPTIQVNEINEKAKPISTENGVYLYTKPMKRSSLISIYRREVEREQFAAIFDKCVGVGGLFFLYKSIFTSWRYIMHGYFPWLLPIHVGGFGFSVYYLLNKRNETPPFSQVLYDLTNNKIQLRSFGSPQILEVALQDAKWDGAQQRAFYIIRLKNVVIKEENIEETREEERVVYLYKNAHIDFQLMHACFSEEVQRVEFTFN